MKNINHKRPFSSSPSQTNIIKTKKNLRILTGSLSSNNMIPNNIKTLKNNLTNSKRHYRNIKTNFKSRPQTTKFSINQKYLKLNLFTKSESELDCLNLIIDSNPNQYNNKLIEKKKKQINPLFIFGSEENLKRPKLSYNTDEVLYKYNLLYANKTQNLIKTYSPKMRPASSSINTFLKKMKYNLKENIPIFTEEEMIIFARAKCRDIGIELRDNILNIFKDFCKMRCKNRVADLSDSYFGINAMKFLVGILYNNDRISRLNLSKNNFGDEGIELLINAVKDSISLVSLDISSNSISHKGGQKIFSIFLNQQSIIDLNISSHEGINRNRLTSMGIKNIPKYLEKNLFIQTLNLSGNSLKNEGFDLICKGLNNNISLLNLNISNNDIQENAIRQSLKRINTTKLYSLNLSNNPILDEGLIILTNSLRHFPDLRVIQVSNCGIEFGGFKELLKILQSVRRIETVDISKNKLSSNKFDQLKTYFCSFGIKNLNLSRCQLGDESAYPLGECLLLNETIKKINISNNKISDIGFKSFVYLFKNNMTIESFDCSCNFISNKTAKDFLSNIDYNRTLKHLNLYDNQIQNDIGSLLLEILERNKTLLTINLLYNRVQLKTIDEINQKLISNNDKEKSKYVPNLKRNIRDLEFDPQDFQKLIKLIKTKKSQQIALAKKVKEDNKNYVRLLSKEQRLVNQKYEYLKKIKDEIKNIDKEINKTEKDIKEDEENLVINEKNIKKRIGEENHTLGEIDIKNIKLKTEYDLVKNEYDDIINETKIRYKATEDSVLDKQNNLKDIHEHFDKLNKLYEKMNNPEFLVPINKKEPSNKRTSKKFRLSRRFSLLDLKKLNDNHDKKPKDNKTDNILSPIVENIDITGSTSPTIVTKSFKKKLTKKENNFNKKK